MYTAIVGGTVVLLDGGFIALGLFPPSHNYGDPDLGWRAAPARGHVVVDRCMEFSTGQVQEYRRNEDGVRTEFSAAEIQADTARLKIATVGDSQTDLCAPNPVTHAGVLESELAAQGIPAIVLNVGAGRYSPLQAYLAFQKVLRPYSPKVLVMNIYTGNDLYDMLRVDDRPHFVPAVGGYRIAEPVWFLYDKPGTRRRSRTLFALRSIADKAGLRGIYLRVQQLRGIAAEQGEGLRSVLAYLVSLGRATERSLGYAGALTAQMLNQQLFFHYFPASRDESMRRTEALMDLIRRENPEMLLVMSPLPSYQLVGQIPVDEALLRTLHRLPISYEGGRREEGQLYERLRVLAGERNWVFVDNLAALRASHGAERLYNGFDYHLLPVASEVVGRTQAAALRDRLRGASP